MGQAQLCGSLADLYGANPSDAFPDGTSPCWASSRIDDEVVLDLVADEVA